MPRERTGAVKNRMIANQVGGSVTLVMLVLLPVAKKFSTVCPHPGQKNGEFAAAAGTKPRVGHLSDPSTAYPMTYLWNRAHCAPRLKSCSG